MQIYAQLKIPHYIIFDPQEHLTNETLRLYKLVNNQYVKQSKHWLARAGLGITFWEGVYEDQEGVWLRWCNRNGNLILTGAERASLEHQRAEDERQRASLERQRAEQADKRAEDEHQRAEHLAAKFREMGINPDQL